MVMRKALSVSLSLTMIVCLMFGPWAQSATAGTSGNGIAAQEPDQDQYQDQDSSTFEPYTADQLDNLLAPIALYPDPLLAQVLPAATFVDQVDEAARWVRANGTNGVDDQDWDVSVRAVAHYPEVIIMMADKLDWTTSLGQAYVYQSTDVMMSVQRLRAMAQSQGNLDSTPQQQVVEDAGYIQIIPAQPQYIYVPAYDPGIVFFRRASFGFAITFGSPFLIGVWLNRDCDWRGRRIFYTGWQGGGWIGRSRPYIHVTNIYVNNRYTNITVNRTVIRRNVNYSNMNRYNYVHRNATFDNRVSNRNVQVQHTQVNNRIIDRNINTNDPRLGQYRGRDNQPRQTAPGTVPRPAPATDQPGQQPPRTTYRPANPPVQRPTPQQQPQPQARPPQQQGNQGPHGFGKDEGNFNPREASQRGRESRSEAQRPPQQQRQAQPQQEHRQAAPPRSNPAKGGSDSHSGKHPG
ncbi:MAG: DUF3300 domain-containing protein [Candidatus Acidiferrales bacterium]